MFSGIIEQIGTIISIMELGNGRRLSISSKLCVGPEGGVGKPNREIVGLGDSIAINGVCLTVEEISPPNQFVVVCGAETISKTKMGFLRKGDDVHLERALRVGDRFDGHLVQGHIDAISSVISCKKEQESYVLWVDLPQEIRRYVAVKGSITLDGISLTVNEIQEDRFRVNIVPYTAEETLISQYRSGVSINIEIDVLARYVERLLLGREDSKKNTWDYWKNLGL
jgi:riboflavin synthase